VAVAVGLATASSDAPSAATDESDRDAARWADEIDDACEASDRVLVLSDALADGRAGQGEGELARGARMGQAGAATGSTRRGMEGLTTAT